MAGIYIHIPFCKTRCIYCDFYSTTLSEFKGRYIQAFAGNWKYAGTICKVPPSRQFI